MVGVSIPVRRVRRSVRPRKALAQVKREAEEQGETNVKTKQRIAQTREQLRADPRVEGAGAAADGIDEGTLLVGARREEGGDFNRL